MSQDIAVSEIRRRILRYWWIPVLCALIGTAVGLIAPKTVPPLYRSQATVLVGSTEGSVTHSSTIRASEDLATFYADMARREVVLRPVVKDLNLPMTWDLLRNQVSATVPPQNPRLVQVVVVAPKAEDARQVANAIVRQLVVLSPPLPGGNEQGFVNNQVQHLKTTIDDGEAEVARLKDELDAATDAGVKDDLRQQIRVQQRLVGYWQRAYVEMISVEPSSDAGGLQVLDNANPVTDMDRSAQIKQAGVGALGGAAVGLVIAWLVSARRARRDGAPVDDAVRPSSPPEEMTAVRDNGVASMRPANPHREPSSHLGGAPRRERAARR
jgi:succinoglycan biosynthesis transport protein ExoP